MILGSSTSSLLGRGQRRAASHQLVDPGRGQAEVLEHGPRVAAQGRATGGAGGGPRSPGGGGPGPPPPAPGGGRAPPGGPPLRQGRGSRRPPPPPPPAGGGGPRPAPRPPRARP